jgi:hypothetical protein
MKKDDIVEGGTYTAKVSGRLVTVRIVRRVETFNGRRRGTAYVAINLSTGRELHLRSAARLRRAVQG